MNDQWRKTRREQALCSQTHEDLYWTTNKSTRWAHCNSCGFRSVRWETQFQLRARASCQQPLSLSTHKTLHHILMVEVLARTVISPSFAAATGRIKLAIQYKKVRHVAYHHFLALENQSSQRIGEENADVRNPAGRSWSHWSDDIAAWGLMLELPGRTLSS